MNTLNFYKSERINTQNSIDRLKKKINRNTIHRLIVFLLVPLLLFGLARFGLNLSISLSVLALVAFGILVRLHVKLRREYLYQQTKNKILDNEIDATNYIFKAFRPGKQYINVNHRYSNDLDLFGEGSLFQMMNRTVTREGETLLAKYLSKEITDKEVIYEYQDCFKELSTAPDFLVHFRTTGEVSSLEKEDKTELHKWQQSKSYISGKKGLFYARYILPSITFGSLIFLIVTGTGFPLFSSFFILNLIATGAFYKKTNIEHSKVSSFLNVLSKYKDLIEVFEQKEFEGKILSGLSKLLNKDNNSAHKALQRLTKLVNAFDSRLNPIVSIILQGLLLYDFHCLFKIQYWKEKYGNNLLTWMESIAKIDALVSMATFASNNPAFVYPEINEENILSAKNTGHPFIPGSVCVVNDFALSKKGNFVIITGANMAGKSTFLRTVGINLVLAMSGLPVYASSFSFTPQKLFTSMRTSDSLNENESYFYAELKRLKELIDLLNNGEDIFIILDEILKGTNSVDKQRGSRLVLKKIIDLKGSGVIATHDLALTDIEQEHPDEIKNKCFEIEIDNSKINFDYKLCDGVTKNMNAMLLMEQMGIV